MIIQYDPIAKGLVNTETITPGIIPNRFFHDQVLKTERLINPHISTKSKIELDMAIGFKLHENSQPFQMGVTGSWIENVGAYNVDNSNIDGLSQIEFQQTKKEQWGRATNKSKMNWQIHFIQENGNQIFEYIGIINLIPALQENDNRIILPRFSVGPEFGYEQVGIDARGTIGQSYGRVIRQLRILKVSFSRIQSDLIDEFYLKVGTIIPHWVIPYHEAISKFPPMWATLTEPPNFSKLDENGWYWNLSLSWKEAY